MFRILSSYASAYGSPPRLLPLPRTEDRSIFYHLWASGVTYTDLGIDAYENAYEKQYRERAVKNLQKKAQALGFNLVAQSNTTQCVS